MGRLAPTKALTILTPALENAPSFHSSLRRDKGQKLCNSKHSQASMAQQWKLMPCPCLMSITSQLNIVPCHYCQTVIIVIQTMGLPVAVKMAARRESMTKPTLDIKLPSPRGMRDHTHNSCVEEFQMLYMKEVPLGSSALRMSCALSMLKGLEASG